MLKWIRNLFATAPQQTRATPMQQLIAERSAFAQPTTAGVSVSEHTAFRIPAYHHGVRLIAQTIASLDLHVYRRLQRGRECAYEHPLYTLLSEEPNEFQTSQGFRETLTGHAVAWGNGYAYIERNGNYRPTALLPLLPDRTYPVRTNGTLTYRTTVNGTQHTLNPYDVVHVCGYGFDGLQGYSPVAMMRNSLGLTVAAEEFGARFFSNGANMGGAFIHPATLSDAAHTHLKQSVADQYTGIANAFRTIILEEGMKFEKFGIPPEDAQFLETRQFQITDIARILGIPPHLIYDLSKATFSNIEQQSIEGVTYSFRPWAIRWEQELKRKLFYESEKVAYFVQHDFNALLRGDSAARSAYYQNQYNVGAITPNEIREAEGRNPVEDGDVTFVNGAMVPLAVAAAAEDVAEGEDPNAPEETSPTGGEDPTDPTGEGLPDNPEVPTAGDLQADPDGQPGPSADPTMTNDTGRSLSLAPVVRDAVGRILRKEAKAVEAAVKKYTEAAALQRWLATWADTHRQYALETLTPVSEAGLPADVPTYVGRHLDASASQLRAALATPAIGRAAALADLWRDWTGGRIATAAAELMKGE